MVSRCRVCNIELTDDNWNWYKRKNHSYICIICDSNGKNKHKQENPEMYRKHRLKSYYNNKQQYRDYARKNRIGTVDENGNKKVIFGKKRDYPLDNNCELCRCEGKRLVYHHWNDSKTMWGMWLCTRCHNVAEYVDSGMNIESYLKLKKEIEEGI